MARKKKARNIPRNFLGIRLIVVSGTRHLSVQFSADENFDDEIWVVLTRHVVDSLRTLDFISLHVDVEDDAIPISAILEDGQHISAKVRLADLDGLSSSNECQTTYTNNIHVLVCASLSTCLYLIS